MNAFAGEVKGIQVLVPTKYQMFISNLSKKQHTTHYARLMTRGRRNCVALLPESCSCPGQHIIRSLGAGAPALRQAGRQKPIRLPGLKLSLGNSFTADNIFKYLFKINCGFQNFRGNFYCFFRQFITISAFIAI